VVTKAENPDLRVGKRAIAFRLVSVFGSVPSAIVEVKQWKRRLLTGNKLDFDNDPSLWQNIHTDGTDRLTSMVSVPVAAGAVHRDLISHFHKSPISLIWHRSREELVVAPNGRSPGVGRSAKLGKIFQTDRDGGAIAPQCARIKSLDNEQRASAMSIQQNCKSFRDADLLAS